MTTVLKNGNVYTMNHEQPFVSALVVEGEKIVYVGTDDGAKAYETDAKVVDLAGKMVIPGMIDAHCHPMLYPVLTSGILLDAEMTKEDVLEEIANYIEEHPDNENYFGIGYPEWHYDVKGPNKSALDAICADKPVFIMSNGIHEAWCNTKTLELLHIDKNTPDPLPGYSFFERDENGQPTGHIVEAAAEQIIFRGMEWFETDHITHLYHEMFDHYSALGVTGFVDCGCFPNFEESSTEYMLGFEKAGELQQRFCSSLMVESPDRMKTIIGELKARRARCNSDLYKVSTLKIVNDGTVESESAAMFEPYNDGHLREPMVSGEVLYSTCVAAAKEGFDVHIHGIGNKAIHENLMAGKAIREAGYYDTRIINAHSSVVRAEDIPLFGKYNILANSSSIWFYKASDITEILGERAKHQYEMVSIIKNGGRVTFGSDMPCDEMGSEPLKGIQMAVTRKLFFQPDMEPLEPLGERMTVLEAIEAYTINAAYGMHWDHITGSLEAGKYADLVVLEKDLNDVPEDDIMNTPILLTMMGGKPTYVSEAFAEIR